MNRTNRPRSPYLLFADLTRPIIKKDYNNISFAELGIIISELYNSLKPEEKLLYNTELNIITPLEMDYLKGRITNYIIFLKKLKQQIKTIHPNENDLFINTTLSKVWGEMDMNEKIL